MPAWASVLSSGALAIHLALFSSPVQYASRLAGAAERGSGGRGRVGALLGPEETGACLVPEVFSLQAAAAASGWRLGLLSVS